MGQAAAHVVWGRHRPHLSRYPGDPYSPRNYPDLGGPKPRGKLPRLQALRGDPYVSEIRCATAAATAAAATAAAAAATPPRRPRTNSCHCTIYPLNFNGGRLR